MAYVNVADWKPDQVTEWLKGLDDVILPYIHSFLENNINGQHLLRLQSFDLERIGVIKIGHQEIILEAVELLRNFHYELDRENLQLLALRLSCLAHSLHSELWSNHSNNSVVSTQVLAEVANVVTAVKPLVCWLDRGPFSDQLSYIDRKNALLKLGLEMATSGQRERFAEKPVENIRQSCKLLADLADFIVRDVDDSLLLQPASLELTTLKKRPGDALGFCIVPSYRGIHLVSELKCNSAAHLNGKIEAGDEIVQVNYQTVVGWKVEEVMDLFEESTSEIILTTKKRPRHSKVHGQIYIKPYRLPCKKKIGYSSRWMELIGPQRADILASPRFNLPIRMLSPAKQIISSDLPKTDKPPPSPTPSTTSASSSVSGGSSGGISGSDNDELNDTGSTNGRIYMPKPHMPVQRRMTVTGASSVNEYPAHILERWWRAFNNEKVRRSNCNGDNKNDKASSETQLRTCRRIRFEENSPNSESASLPASCQHIPEIIGNFKMNDDGQTMIVSGGKVEYDTAEDVMMIPVKERISSFNKVLNQNQNLLQSQKPKLLPKPIIENKTSSSGQPPPKPPISGRSKPIAPIKLPIEFAPTDPSTSPRRERGKLDKSYSTPTYDYSADFKDVMTVFTPNPQSKTNRKMDFENTSLPFKISKQTAIDCGDQNAYLELNPDVESKSDENLQTKNNNPGSTFGELQLSNEYLKIKDENLQNESGTVKFQNEYLEIKGEEKRSVGGNEAKLQNEYLEIKNDEILLPKDDGGLGKVLKLHNEYLEIKNDPPCSLINQQNHFDDVKPKNSCLPTNVTVADVELPRLNKIIANSAANVLPPLLFCEYLSRERGETTKENNGDLILSIVKEKMLSKITKNNISYPIPIERPFVDTSPHIVLPRHKLEFERPLAVPAPEPPPRPVKALSVQQNKLQSNDKDAISKSTKGTLHKSPRSLRKKNPLLAKRRNVSIKDLGICDHSGWLYHRSRKVGGAGSPHWIKGWFIIKGSIFYGFNNNESTHARLMISLPGFTVSPAEEVKSRHFSFKVYHTGTTFYFAAECAEDLAGWVESFQRVTISEQEQSMVMSETDGEDDEEENKPKENSGSGSGGVSSLTPAIKKLSGLLSGHLMHSDSSKSEKKFSSLKKGASRKSGTKDDSGNAAMVETGSQVVSASLDRKYLKFLGGSTKQNIVPIPTAQFRSYRRVATSNNLTDSLPSTPEHSRSNSITSDTPITATVSPSRPPDMADYRLASLAKSNNTATSPRSEESEANSNGVGSLGGIAGTEASMTLETFMVSRQQEEERRHHQVISPAVRSAAQMLRVPQCHAPPPPTVVTVANHHIRSAPSVSTAATGLEENTAPVFSLLHTASSSSTNSSFSSHDQAQDRKTGGLLKEKPAAAQVAVCSTRIGGGKSSLLSKRLKKTAQYQPPPWEITASGPSGGTNEELRLHAAFEMTLDNDDNNRSRLNESRRSMVAVECGKTSTKLDTGNTRFKNLFNGATKLGSPRLRRVVSKDKQRITAAQQSNDIAHASSSFPQQNTNQTNASEVEQVSNETMTEYPGLEYPPVFEPETYSLSDVSTILRARSIRNNANHTANNLIYANPNDCSSHPRTTDGSTRL